MKRVVVEKGIPGVQHAICDHPGCSNYLKANCWGFIRGHDDGWFLKKNGDCWCPQHIPEWVTTWKANKERRH